MGRKAVKCHLLGQKQPLQSLLETAAETYTGSTKEWSNRQPDVYKDSSQGSLFLLDKLFATKMFRKKWNNCLQLCTHW